MVILELGLLVSVQTVYDRMSNKFNTFALQKLLEQFCIKYKRDSILSQSVFLMLETDDSIRHDFIKLRERLPRFEDVRKFLLSQRQISTSGATTPQSTVIITEKQSFVENPMAVPARKGFSVPRAPAQANGPILSPNESFHNYKESPMQSPDGLKNFRVPLAQIGRVPSQLKFDVPEQTAFQTEDRKGLHDSGMNKHRTEYDSVQIA